ncbi:hypothetical protein OPV22_001427 [Ensete ventricosum]|uniref:Uncharacterized protein n=1 Tax=Ensete ventricosum TaxID=4639 RepID=A0AAV8RTG2_ENSVE|nr:hypothetical protein OPV22_001427 [Ensete ventricosum]
MPLLSGSAGTPPDTSRVQAREEDRREAESEEDHQNQQHDHSLEHVAPVTCQTHSDPQLNGRQLGDSGHESIVSELRLELNLRIEDTTQTPHSLL